MTSRPPPPRQTVWCQPSGHSGLLSRTVAKVPNSIQAMHHTRRNLSECTRLSMYSHQCYHARHPRHNRHPKQIVHRSECYKGSNHQGKARHSHEPPPRTRATAKRRMCGSDPPQHERAILISISGVPSYMSHGNATRYLGHYKFPTYIHTHIYICIYIHMYSTPPPPPPKDREAALVDDLQRGQW